MAQSDYKGKYTEVSTGNWTVELYQGSTLKRTDTFVENEGDCKAIIIAWHAQQGGEDESVTSDNFTPDMDNFNSLYLYT